MIISKGRRYIFVHIPKTGGTSLALALEARAMKDDILIGDTEKARKRRGRLTNLNAAGRIWKHSTLRDIEGVVETAEMQDFMVFTMVRNPWDRMLSYYCWLKDQTFEHPAVTLARSTTFSGFLQDTTNGKSLQAAPYGSYVTGPTGVEFCDAYVRLEHLAEDLEPVEDHLGFRLEMPHVNQSKRPKDYRGVYTNEDADRVAEICAEDIARFGYAF